MAETKKRGRPPVKKDEDKPKKEIKDIYIFQVCGAAYGYSYFGGDEVDGELLKNKEELLNAGVIKTR